MKLFTNKKGFGLLILVGLGILFASIMMIIFIDDVKLRESIGIKQYNVLYTNEKIEAAQTYLDEALPYAAQRAEDNMYEASGIPSSGFGSGLDFSSPCGTHIYPMYTSPSIKCLPEFRGAYKLYTEQNLKRYVDNYDGLTLLSSLSLDVISTNERKTRLQAAALSPRPISIESKWTFTQKDESKKIYPRGILGTYGTEKTIICANGYCFSELIKYYHELYQRAGFTFSYVEGGESPYTYADSAEDKKNNPYSIFKNAELNEFAPGTSIKTEPGFDNSGWLWWVGIHAGLPQFSQRKDLTQIYEFLEATKTETIICKKDDEKFQECTYEFLRGKLEYGDLLFIDKNGAPDHVAIYVDEGIISHSRPGFGLVQHDIPSAYLNEKTTNIHSIIRLSYPSQGQEYFLTPQKEQDTIATSTNDEALADDKCQLPIDLSQINIDAIRSGRDEIVKDPESAVESFNKKLLDTNQLDTIARASSKFNIPPEYIKSIIMTEVGYGTQGFQYLTGETPSRVGSNIVGPMQIGKPACADVNKQKKSAICNHALIKQGGYEGAVNGIESGTAYLDILTLSNNIDSDKPNLYFLALAYNAGVGTLNNVLKHASARTSIPIDQLQWRDIQRSDVEYAANANGWGDAKVTEVFEYPNHVAVALSGQCDGDFFASYQISSSTMDFAPKLTTTTNVDLESLGLIEKFVDSIITCDDDLRNCVQEKVEEFNTENSLNVLITTKGEQESIAYELTDQLLDCSKNGQRDCICDIELEVEERAAFGPSFPSEDQDEPEYNSILFPKVPQETLTSEIENLVIELGADGKLAIGTIEDDEFVTEQPPLTLPFPLHEREGESSLNNLYLAIDTQDNNHVLYRPARSSPSWELGKDMEQLAIYKEGDYSFRNTKASEKQEIVVEYAKKYLGTGYSGVSTCSAEDAIAKRCTTQCGSFITNTFRFGLGLPETKLPYGNGNVKCTNSGNLLPGFKDVKLLEPGDIFASTSPTSPAGHTGIFVGYGSVGEPVKKGYCYNQFNKDIRGEPVFIHSVGPVCYNTYTQLFAKKEDGGQGREIYNFCRHKELERLQSEEVQPVVSEVVEEPEIPYRWIAYNQEKQEKFLCRDNKNNFRFQAKVFSENKIIPFSIYLEDVVAPNFAAKEIGLRTCDTKDVVVLSWSISKEEEKIYSFTIQPTVGGQSPEGLTLQETSAIETTETDPTKIDVLNQLFKRDTSLQTHYYYLINRVREKNLEPGKTYSFDINVYDHYENSIDILEAPTLEIEIPPPPEDSLLDSTAPIVGQIVDIVDELDKECTDVSGVDSGLFGNLVATFVPNFGGVP